MDTDYNFKATIAGDEHELYVRSRIEAILEGMEFSGGNGGQSGTDPSNARAITSDELAAMWES